MTDPRLHYCEAAGCIDWGSFGFTLAKGRPLLWYCGAHRQLGIDRVTPAPDPDPEPVRVVQRQGFLL